MVGVSAGGAFAQLLALAFPKRVLSLVLISTSPAMPGERRLPPATERYRRFLATAEVDWSDRGSVDRLPRRLFADARRRRAALRRGRCPGARPSRRRARPQHRGLREPRSAPEGELPHAPLSSIAVPTLVIHGTADPMFPLEHGQALAKEIPGARLLTLDGAGHGVDRADWETIARAILEHTATRDRETSQPQRGRRAGR